jgi:hypothetical protein
MSHFAKIDKNDVVIDILVCDNSMPNEGYDWLIENFDGRWVKTSYNATIRSKYAAIGDTYNKALDAFISPQPYPSWVLDEETARWEAPVACPTDEATYIWDEEAGNWVALDFPETPAE